VRVALHTGPAYLSNGDYFGTTLNRCARLLAVTRGGQTLLSSATEALVCDGLPIGASLRDLGMVRLRDVAHPVHVFQLVHPGLREELLDIGEAAQEGKHTGQPTARFRPIDLYEVPTLPAIVIQALKIMQDPNSDAKAVESVISRDPAISGKVLRVANSAFFGYSRRVASIADAIRVLGFNNVQGMIIGIGAFDAFRTERLNLSDFWQHSIATATAAGFLAPRVGCPADEAFTAGILHDIGKLVFAIQAEQAYRRVIELERGGTLRSLDAERTLFEFTHPEVGETVAERWALPARYVAAIAHHHDPSTAGAESAFCALIGLADHAAHAALEGDRGLTTERDADGLAVSDTLGLGAAQWDACLLHVQEAQPNIEAFVGVIR
jgi:putative nucleotidyltransferase with HDIG domain